MKKIYDVDIIVDDKNIFIEVFASSVAGTISGLCKVTTFENNVALQERSFLFTCENRNGRDSAIAAAFVHMEQMLTKDNAATRRIRKVIADYYSYYNEEYPEDHIF